MNLIKCYQTHSSWYKGAMTGSKPVGVLWHDTAAGNPTLKRYVQPYETDANYDAMIALLGKNKHGNDWNHIDHKAGLNAWIGELADGTMATIQAADWNKHPWGCGSGKLGSCNGYTIVNGKRTWTNEHWIQFEICDDGYKDETYFKRAYKEACEFTAHICELYGIDPNGTVVYNGVKVPTILCHADSYKLGLGSDHGDVYSWFKKFGHNMTNVRNDVATLMKNDVAQDVEPSVTFELRDIVKIKPTTPKADKPVENTPTPTPKLTGTASTGSKADEKKLWDFLYEKIGNEYGVAGLMGNLYAESALRSNNLQNTYEKPLGYTDDAYTSAVDNGSYTNFIKDKAGYGLAQWAYWSRKQNLIKYAKSVNKSICDFDMQLEFLFKELSGDYKATLMALKSAQSVAEASTYVLVNFETPANQGESIQVQRASYSQKYYDSYHLVVDEPVQSKPEDNPKEAPPTDKETNKNTPDVSVDAPNGYSVTNENESDSKCIKNPEDAQNFFVKLLNSIIGFIIRLFKK